MASVKQAFGGSTAIGCSLASLATGSARSSDVIDNGSNCWLDALVNVSVKLQAGTLAGDKCVYVFAYGSEDGGIYSGSSGTSDAIDGTDKAITMGVPTILRMIGSVPCDAQSVTFRSLPMSVAAAFGGILPRKWGIVVYNATGVTLSATEGDHNKSYSGVAAVVA